MKNERLNENQMKARQLFVESTKKFQKNGINEYSNFE